MSDIVKSTNSTTEAIMDEIGKHRPANPDSPFTILIDQTVLRDILDKHVSKAQENQWQQAVLNECFAIEGCYKESDPAGTLTCLINWHVLNERDHAPAQEDEPVLWYGAEERARGADIRHIIGSMLYSTTVHSKKPKTSNPVWPLYTHPDNSELLKTAQELIAHGEHGGGIFDGEKHFDNLRDALNKRKS